MAEQSDKKIKTFTLARILTAIVCWFSPGATGGLFSFLQAKQEKSVREVAYQLAAERFNFQLADQNPTDNSLFENYLKTFGLLPDKGYIKWHGFLQGEKNGVHFTLQDTSWMLGKRSGLLADDTAKAQYTVLTIPQYHSINCNVLIKNKKMFDGGIRLKQLEVGNSELENLYDIYSDNPAETITLLNDGFSQTLLGYVQLAQKQAEFIITPQKVFVLFPYDPGAFGSPHSAGWWDRPVAKPFTSADPHTQCDKIVQDICDILEIISALSSLENPQA